MDYGPAPESDSAVRAWLKSRGGKFGIFIDNEFRKPEGRALGVSTSPCDGSVLAHTVEANNDDVDDAVAAARTAQKSWAALSPHARSRHLYSVARHMQKHHRLLAVLESLDNGKSIRETRDADVPLAIRHFYSHAGWPVPASR